MTSNDLQHSGMASLVSAGSGQDSNLKQNEAAMRAILVKAWQSCCIQSISACPSEQNEQAETDTDEWAGAFWWDCAWTVCWFCNFSICSALAGFGWLYSKCLNILKHLFCDCTYCTDSGDKHWQSEVQRLALLLASAALSSWKMLDMCFFGSKYMEDYGGVYDVQDKDHAEPMKNRPCSLTRMRCGRHHHRLKWGTWCCHYQTWIFIWATAICCSCEMHFSSSFPSAFGETKWEKNHE